MGTTKKQSMGEISRRVAEDRPEKLVLSDGTAVTIGKMGFTKFTSMWQSCTGLIKAYLAMNRADKQVESETFAYMQLAAAITPEERKAGSLDEARAAMRASDTAFDDVSAGLLNAPGLLVDLVCACTKTEKEFWVDEENDRPFTDVLLAGTLAFKVNFGAFLEFAPFLESLMNALTVSVDAADPKEKTG